MSKNCQSISCRAPYWMLLGSPSDAHECRLCAIFSGMLYYDGINKDGVLKIHESDFLIQLLQFSYKRCPFLGLKDKVFCFSNQ